MRRASPRHTPSLKRLEAIPRLRNRRRNDRAADPLVYSVVQMMMGALPSDQLLHAPFLERDSFPRVLITESAAKCDYDQNMGSNFVGVISSILLTFFVLCFRNIRM